MHFSAASQSIGLRCTKDDNSLLRNGARGVVLGDDLLRVILKGSSLRKKFERLDDLRIVLRANLQAFFLAELVHEDLALDVGADPVVVVARSSSV